ncbi:TFIIH complex kinase subunit CCL1, partial [Ascoidea rubescens DSM 1968]
KRVTDDDLYRRSSQYRLWSFNQKHLMEKRQRINENGRNFVLNKLRDLIFNDDKILGDNDFKETKFKEISSKIEFVDVEEEIKMINYYSRRVEDISKIFNLSSEVKATALSFLKKFYLEKSCMEYHPKKILYTCLFLAAKSENCFISIDKFIETIGNITKKSILSLEYKILNVLNFTLMVHHPYKPLYGFFLDIQYTLIRNKPNGMTFFYTENLLNRDYSNAKNLVKETLISDVQFLFTPPQIALACFLQVNEEITIAYLKQKFRNKRAFFIEDNATITNTLNNNKNYRKLLSVIRSCQKLMKESFDPSIEEATNIDKKIYYCTNPKKLINKERKK